MINREMILQRTAFPKESFGCHELYYILNGTGERVNNSLKIGKGTTISTLTYVNCFDTWAWNKYTGLDNWKLEALVWGNLTLRLFQWNGEKKLIAETQINTSKKEILTLEFSHSKEGSLVFFEIEAKGEAILYNANYKAEVAPGIINRVHLSVLICTYNRNKELYQSLEVLSNSIFFDKTSICYGSMSVRIVDNASQLPIIAEDLIKLYHNPNTGGSGGFTRGIIESRKDEAKYEISHVVFMDDDAEVEEESLYRLYILLSLIKSSYKNEVVAGRMFDLNKKFIQYTASEIWNKGDIKHVGFKLDMGSRENLLEMNRKQGQYAGWWFACYPMSFVRNETPLPFFIHCDDVEYGLRHGGTPIILNGIQAWHETYETRLSPLICYYDTRNTMIVNTIYNQYENKNELLKKWYLSLIYALRAKEYYKMFPSLLALIDYLKGSNYFMSQTMKKEKVDKPIFVGLTITLVLAIVQFPIFRHRLKYAFPSYKEINKKT